MGFLKKLHITYFILILLFGCTRAIHFYDYNENAEKISLYGNNSQRNFYVNQNVTINKEPLWDTSIYASFSKSSFVAYDSILFVSDLGGRITAINIKNGKKNGEIKYKGSIEQAPILDDKNLIFILNETQEKSSELIVYDFVDGSERENTKLDGKVTNEFILQNGNIYVLADFGMLYKFNINGVLLWHRDLHTNFFSDPAADEKNLYGLSLDGNLFSVNLETGDIIYKKKIAAGFQSGISLKNQNLFFGDEDGNMFSVNKNNGKINWKYNTKFKIKAIPSFDKSSVYIGNLNGDLYSFNIHEGNLNWILKTEGLINTTPIIFKNMLVQPNLKKQVDLVDKLNGKIIESISFVGRCRTTPFYFTGKLFFGIDKDDVYCFKVNEI